MAQASYKENVEEMVEVLEYAGEEIRIVDAGKIGDQFCLVAETNQFIIFGLRGTASLSDIFTVLNVLPAQQVCPATQECTIPNVKVHKGLLKKMKEIKVEDLMELATNKKKRLIICVIQQKVERQKYLVVRLETLTQRLRCKLLNLETVECFKSKQSYKRNEGQHDNDIIGQKYGFCTITSSHFHTCWKHFYHL